MASTHNIRFTDVCTLNMHIPPRLSSLAEKPGFLKGVEASSFRDLYSTAALTLNPGPDFATEFVQTCMIGHAEGIQKLIESGQAPNLTSSETAFRFGYLALAVIGAQRIGGGHTAMDHAGVIRLLIEQGCPVDNADIGGYTALFHSVTNSPRLDLARILLEAGASPNQQNKCAGTPMHVALKQGHWGTVELLMEYDADLDIPDDEDQTVRATYTSQGPEGTAIIEKWLRKRAGDAPLPDIKTCRTCGVKATEKPLRFCSRCRTVKYCSSTCQRTDWSSHKPHCRSIAGADTVRVKPYYPDGNFTILPIASSIREGSARKDPGINVPNYPPGPRDINQLDSKEDMTIKIGIPLSSVNGPMKVYNNKHTFNCLIRRDDNRDSYDRLLKVIHNKGVKAPGLDYGVKAYFQANLSAREVLTIRIDTVLAPQPF